MKRKLSLILISAMVLSLTACGNSSATSTTKSTEAAEAESSASADDQDSYNPDTEEDSMTIEEVREKNGDVPVTEGITLGVVEKSLSNEFWRTLKEGYEAAADVVSKQGINVTFNVNGTTDEGDEIGQQTMADNMINQGCSALLLSPISDSNLSASVENALDAKIPVVNVDDGLIADADYYVGPNAYENGQLAAEWISKQLGDTGQVAIVVGMAKAFAARERTSGFKDWISDNNSGLDVVAEQNADWDREKSKELAATWIQQYPDLKAIFCNNDDMALGVVEAVKEADADILVVGVDGIGEAYDSIRDGGLDATVDSFPYYMGQIATECTLRALAGQDMPHVVSTPLALIDSTNVDEDAADIIDWTDPTYTVAE